MPQTLGNLSIRPKMVALVAVPVAADLVHLPAELLDNAAGFSPPAAPIVVSAAADGDDHLVEVTDRGLGMTDQELAWANRRLGRPAGAVPAGAVLRTTLAPASALRRTGATSPRPPGNTGPRPGQELRQIPPLRRY